MTKLTSLLAFYLLVFSSNSQGCFPLNSQSSGSNYAISAQQTTSSSQLISPSHESPSISNLACVKVAPPNPIISTPFKTSAPTQSVTIKISGSFPDTPQITPNVQGPAYYQNSAIYPWGPLTPMKFDTVTYPSSSSSNSYNQITNQVTNIPPPIISLPEPTPYPILTQPIIQTSNINIPVTTAPSVEPQNSLTYGSIQIQNQTNTNYINSSSQTSNLQPLPIYPTANQIPLPTVVENPITIPTFPSTPLIQQSSTTQSTVSYQGGSNLIPIVGPTPVPVTNNYNYVNQFTSVPQISSQSYVPISIATNPINVVDQSSGWKINQSSNVASVNPIIPPLNSAYQISSGSVGSSLYPSSTSSSITTTTPQVTSSSSYLYSSSSSTGALNPNLVNINGLGQNVNLLKNSTIKSSDSASLSSQKFDLGNFDFDTLFKNYGIPSSSSNQVSEVKSNNSPQLS